jgi:hypothetical protein
MKSKHLVKLLVTAVTALAALPMMGAVAQADTPAPGYEAFAGCPSPSENAAVTNCLRSVIKSGHFQMGSKDVPITNPIILIGGTDPSLSGFAYNSKGGLLPAKQPVPGGVIGLTGLDWLVNFLSLEGLKLYAVTELAGTPDFSGETVPLPIKVHLINPVLGNNCYVGSNSNPINLNLTTGTTSPPAPNKPISGSPPKEVFFDAAKGIFHVYDFTLVDNSFAAPGASGCVLTLFGFIPVSLNGVVNSQAGLPAAAGTNETIQNIDQEITARETVYP